MPEKTAIVTGGGRGIGRAIVARFRAEGLQVLTCGRGDRPTDLDSDIAWVKADVSDAGDANRLVAEAKSRLGPVEILINNAGVQLEKTVATTTDAEWDLVMGVNALAQIQCGDAVADLYSLIDWTGQCAGQPDGQPEACGQGKQTKCNQSHAPGVVGLVDGLSLRVDVVALILDQLLQQVLHLGGFGKERRHGLFCLGLIARLLGVEKPASCSK